MAKEPTITQQAAHIVTVDGPVKIRGSKAFNAAGEVVARVGIDLTEDDE